MRSHTLNDDIDTRMGHGAIRAEEAQIDICANNGTSLQTQMPRNHPSKDVFKISNTRLRMQSVVLTLYSDVHRDPKDVLDMLTTSHVPIGASHMSVLGQS